MNSTGVRKMLLAFDAPGRWSHARYQKKHERAQSGSTSIRVSKSTLDALRRLADEIGAVTSHASPDWDYRPTPLSELLDWFATGIVLAPGRELADACTEAIVEKYSPDEERVG